MQLLWTYSIFLEDERNDEEVLSLITSLLECDIISSEIVTTQMKQAQRLQELKEYSIYEEVMTILHQRASLMSQTN